MIGGIAVVAVLVVGGLAAFLTLRTVPAKLPAPRPNPQAVPAPAPKPPLPTNTPAEVPSPPAEPTEPTTPTADQDTDVDGLTDAEEVLLGTDIGLKDTDADGYDDRTELLNLYNPTGIAPQRLIDAGLVYAYEHPIDHWEIYVPTKWSVRATDQEQQEVVIATGVAGEDIAVAVLQNPQRLPFPEFAVGEFNVPDAGNPSAFRTRRGAQGFRYADPKFAYFIPAPDRTLTISHRLSSIPPRYPHLFEMIVQSFRAPTR